VSYIDLYFARVYAILSSRYFKYAQSITQFFYLNRFHALGKAMITVDELILVAAIRQSNSTGAIMSLAFASGRTIFLEKL
jgi:predicted YcjX-like family ATPase